MIYIVAVEYHEPEYKKTVDSISSVDVPVVFIDRNGTGSLAEAYNKGFKQIKEPCEYVWFVSNISFGRGVLKSLLEAIGDYAAIQPSYMSDHISLQPGKGIEEVPFVEFTCPLVRYDVFEKFPLDENMPYWGHDLDWGHRIREAGFKLACHKEVQIGHTYIRHGMKYRVTRERARLRKESNASTTKALENKYGKDWKEYLQYR